MMKRLICAILTFLLTVQAFPVDALATVGRALTSQELARAYAMTGFGEGEGVYHNGMKPNASWNASQLDDWLEEKLSKDLKTVNEIFSQSSYTLEKMKAGQPELYSKYADDGTFQKARALYLEAEKLRETLRYYQDQLKEASGVIAEMSRWMGEDGASMFDSDRVRYSARIEEAEQEIIDIRTVIVENADAWAAQIDSLQRYLQFGPTGSADDGPWIGEWISALLSDSGEPVSNTATVSRVSPTASRMSRLSAAAGVASNTVDDVKITVIDESEVALVLQTGTNEKPVPVKDISVKASDALKPESVAETYTTNEKGTVVLPINKFTQDEFDVIHLRLEVDPTAQGYLDYIVEDLDLEKGEVYTNTLTPIGEASADGTVSNAQDDPYVYMMSFDKKDIMHSQYDMIYSPVNNYEFEIRVGVKNTEGKSLPDLLMRYYTNDGGWSVKECWASPTGREGDVYVFKGAWKSKFAPLADQSKGQWPTFMFGKDAGANLTFPSMLKSNQSATEEPINEGTGPNGGVFANVLGKGLGAGFKIPTVDINVNFNIPFQQYLPRLFVDPGGFVTIYLGSAAMEDSVKKSKLNWQSKDARKFQQAQKWVEQKGAYANYKAQYNLAKDYYKTKDWKFLGTSSIDVGIFAVLTGRWELDDKDPDVIASKNVSLRGGVGATISYSYSWTISYPVGPVPVYVCFTLGVSAGFALEAVVNFSIVDGELHGFEFKPFNDITIDIGFMFSAQLGIGIKGFLEAWVKLTASLDFIIKLSIMDMSPSGLTINGDISFTVGATVFFVSFSKTWDLVSGQIYPASNANLLEYYMNADGGKAQEIEAVSDAPHRYPALTVDATEESWTTDQNNAGSSYKVVRAGGKTFLFVIQIVGTVEGKIRKRVSWRCLDPDSSETSFWGSTEPCIEERWNGHWEDGNFAYYRDDYDFDVYSEDRFVYLVATCAKDFDKDGFPIRNELKDTWRSDLNMGIYIVVLESDGKNSLNYKLSVKNRGTENVVFGFAASQGQSAFGSQEQFSYDSCADPKITYAHAIWKDAAKTQLDHFEIYGQLSRVPYTDDAYTAGTTGFAYDGSFLSFFTDKLVKSGMGDDYQRVEALTLMDMDAVGRAGTYYSTTAGYSLSFVGLSQPKSGTTGDSAIELFGWDMNATGKQDGRSAVALEKGNIGHIAMAQNRTIADRTQAGRTVFYTMQEVNDDGAAQNRLYGLYIAPVKDMGTQDPQYEVTKYKYDAVIPATDFDVCYIGDVPYLYWASLAEKENESDPDVWRIWIMCYDESTNTMTDASVFAEFKLPTISYNPRDQYGTGYWYDLNASVQQIMLTGTGTGYLDAVANDVDFIRESLRPIGYPHALLSFPERNTPTANLTCAIPKELAVKAGDFEDVTLGLRNEGNLGIVTFDISMYEVTGGQESATPVETVHFNAVDPSKSKLTLPDGSVVISGEQVGYREEDYDNTSRKRDWVLDQETKNYRVHVGDADTLSGVDVIQASDPRHIQTDVLMPGSTGSYSAAFKIPGDWHGDKTLRMKVTGLSVESNLARAVANAAGITSNGAGGGSVRLNYALNPRTGKLELQKPVQANGAEMKGIDLGLYADAIESASTDMIVHIHDLEIKHRVYRGLEGEQMLDIVVHNHANTEEALTLSCAVYVDGAREPSHVLNLPYYESVTSSRKTHTFTLPLGALVDEPAKHERARVVITAVGREERAYANNEFTVYLGGADPLRFTKQPEDATVQEGEDVSFSVEVAGGVKPYRYQWQVYNPKTGKWVDLKGFTEATIDRKKIEKKWDGCKFRCVVTDAAGTQIISQEVTLTVRDGVDTGDDTNLPLYLALALVALALLAALRRRGRIGKI